MSRIKRYTANCKSIGDHPVLAVALLTTFVIGALGSFKVGFIAYGAILGTWRLLTCRMPTCRDLTLYIVGVIGVLAAMSWLEYAVGRTDFTKPLVASVVALCVGLLWGWDWIRRE